eukprot:95880-Pyramimonas_sp.AAC.1
MCRPMVLVVELARVGKLETVLHAGGVLHAHEVVVPAASVGGHVEAQEPVVASKGPMQQPGVRDANPKQLAHHQQPIGDRTAARYGKQTSQRRAGQQGLRTLRRGATRALAVLLLAKRGTRDAPLCPRQTDQWTIIPINRMGEFSRSVE